MVSAHDTGFDAERWFDILLNEPDLYRLQAALFQEKGRFGSWYKVADALGEVLYEIGLKWQGGEWSVLEEHVVSKRLERALTSCISSIQLAPNPHRCLLLTAQDDMHTLGLSLSELCAREQGWLGVWLGTEVPLSDLNTFLKDNPFDMVLVSASAWSNNKRQLSKWYEQAAEICSSYGSHLVLGGTGAWPKDLTYGERFIIFEDFAYYLKELS